MSKITLEQVSIGDTMQTKYGLCYKVGIKEGGVWHNGLVGEKQIAEVKKWNAGDQVLVELYQKQSNGKTFNNWKLPNKNSELQSTVELMGKLIKQHEERIKSLEAIVLNKKDVDEKQENTNNNPTEDDLPF